MSNYNRYPLNRQTSVNIKNETILVEMSIGENYTNIMEDSEKLEQVDFPYTILKGPVIKLSIKRSSGKTMEMYEFLQNDNEFVSFLISALQLYRYRSNPRIENIMRVSIRDDSEYDYIYITSYLLPTSTGESEYVKQNKYSNFIFNEDCSVHNDPNLTDGEVLISSTHMSNEITKTVTSTIQFTFGPSSFINDESDILDEQYKDGPLHVHKENYFLITSNHEHDLYKIYIEQIKPRLELGRRVIQSFGLLNLKWDSIVAISHSRDYSSSTLIFISYPTQLCNGVRIDHVGGDMLSLRGTRIDELVNSGSIVPCINGFLNTPTHFRCLVPTMVKFSTENYLNKTKVSISLIDSKIYAISTSNIMVKYFAECANKKPTHNHVLTKVCGDFTYAIYKTENYDHDKTQFPSNGVVVGFVEFIDDLLIDKDNIADIMNTPMMLFMDLEDELSEVHNISNEFISNFNKYFEKYTETYIIPVYTLNGIMRFGVYCKGINDKDIIEGDDNNDKV